MRIGIISTIIASHLYWAASGPCQEPGAALPAPTALRFFDGLGTADGDSVLRALRRKPISARQRDLVRSKLPSTGAVTPTRDEAKKLAAMLPVLMYHERGNVFDVKVIDIPQAYVGLYHRATLLVSRSALSVLEPSELEALAAHEIGHELLWEAVERQRHGHVRQELELECDGVAALTLRALGLDPMRVIAALEKFERFNKRFGSPVNPDDYPTLADRTRFITELLVRFPRREGSAFQRAPNIRNQLSGMCLSGSIASHANAPAAYTAAVT